MAQWIKARGIANGRARTRALGVGGVALSMAAASASLADCDIALIHSVQSSEEWISDYFGRAVDIDGDYAVIGSEAEDLGFATGAVYIFKRIDGAWVEQVRIAGAEGNSGFGEAVAISGDTIVVGAWKHGSNGAAFVFVRSGDEWIEQAKLEPANPTPAEEFGRSVEIEGDSIIVGSLRVTFPDALTSGAAYVFARTGDTWAMQGFLTPPNPVAQQQTGKSVAISGDTAVVGNPSDDAFESNSGAAYVFHRSGGVWTFAQKLKAPDLQRQDYFGDAVAIEGDVLLVGAARDDQACPEEIHCNSGSVYVYKRVGSVWEFDQLVTSANSETGNFFGYSFGLKGDVMVVGAHHAAATHGRAYVFRKIDGVWTELMELYPDEPFTFNQFGIDVATDGETAVFGAVNQNLPHPGRAAFYDLNCSASVAADLNGDGVVNGADLAALLSSWGPCGGCAADLNGDGVVDGADLAALLASWG